MRHGRPRPLARWHVAVVQKLRIAPEPATCTERSCLTGQALLREFGRDFKARLRCLRVYPIERHDLKQLGLTCPSPPTANAGNLLRAWYRGGFALQANPLLAFWTFQNELVGFVHAHHFKLPSSIVRLIRIRSDAHLVLTIKAKSPRGRALHPVRVRVSAVQQMGKGSRCEEEKGRLLAPPLSHESKQSAERCPVLRGEADCDKTSPGHSVGRGER